MAATDFQSPLPPRPVSPELATDSVDLPPPPVSSPPPPESPPSLPTAPVRRLDPSKIALLIVGLILLIGLLFLVFKVVLPGLKGRGPTSIVNLTYWGLWEPSATLDAVIAEFESQNPGIKVKYSKQEKFDYRSRLKGRLAKSPGSDTEVPDIFRLHNTWIPTFTDELAAVPTSTANTIGLNNDYYSIFQRDLAQNGRFLAVPLMYDSLALYYNKKLLQDAQVNPPLTWWGLENAATKLTVRDQNNQITIAGAALGLTENIDHWPDIIGLMLLQNGVKPFVADDPKNDQKLLDVLTYYSLFYSQLQVWDSSLPESTQAFANGKLAFYFAPSWRTFNLLEINPALQFEITTAPQLPTLESASAQSIEQSGSNDNLTNIHYATYWAEGVNSKSQHQAEAFKLLEFLSRSATLEKMFTAQKQTREFGEIYPRKSMAGKISTDPRLRPFTVAAPNTYSFYLASRTWDDSLNSDLSRYFGNALNRLTQDRLDPKDVLPELRNGLTQVQSKYGL